MLIGAGCLVERSEIEMSKLKEHVLAYGPLWSMRFHMIPLT
jgi:hypothetical protein